MQSNEDSSGTDRARDRTLAYMGKALGSTATLWVGHRENRCMHNIQFILI